MTGYYRRFVKNYGILAQPITSLLKVNSFIWNAEAQTTWDLLKQAMVIALVLALPDFNATFVVKLYAFSIGIGVVLS